MPLPTEQIHWIHPPEGEPRPAIFHPAGGEEHESGEYEYLDKGKDGAGLEAGGGGEGRWLRIASDTHLYYGPGQDADSHVSETVLAARVLETGNGFLKAAVQIDGVWELRYLRSAG